MQVAEFNRVIKASIEHIRKTLLEKGAEYTPAGGDRLHNFKRAAELQQCTPEQALWGMCAKHIVSISDMVRANVDYPDTVWDEKIGDALNYLLLLRAQVAETKDTNNEKGDA